MRECSAHNELVQIGEGKREGLGEARGARKRDEGRSRQHLAKVLRPVETAAFKPCMWSMATALVGRGNEKGEK
jgi:hypothetical protein